MEVGLNHSLILAAAVFLVGLVGFVTRRNTIIICFVGNGVSISVDSPGIGGRNLFYSRIFLFSFSSFIVLLWSPSVKPTGIP